MSLPRYPEYKDSGVAWLGEVPAHWGVNRLKQRLRLLTDKTDRREHPIALENIESWSGRHIETESEFQGDGVAFEAGDILFGKLRPYLAKGLVAQKAGEAVGDFHVMRPLSGVSGRYALYQMLTRSFIHIVDGSTFGAKMPRVSWEFMANLPLLTPPAAEQSAIATFLDNETAKIDALVAEQEKLLTLLAEKRLATISHAVTKGLNRDAPMKDSGVEWLGDVPAHWGVNRLKQRLRLLTDKTDRREYPVALENIESWSGRYIETVSEFQGEGVAFEAGDILFGKLRPYLAKGWVAQKPGEAVGDFHVMRPLSGVSGHYALYQMLTRSFIHIVDGSTFGAKMPRVSWDFMANLPLLVPPATEQSAIVAFLDQETARLDALTTEATRAIALLKERRSALISAAVTGKIDVRELI